MVKTKVDTSRVLIVPGFTNEENLLRSSRSTKKSVPEPTSFLFEANSVDVNPHRKNYEEFRSADGLLLIEKACDEYAEISMNILVHQNLSNMKGNLVIEKNTKEVRLRVTDNSIPKDNNNDDELLLGRYVRPEEFTDEYIEVRSGFFEDLDGRPLTLISPLFKSIPVAYIVDCSYNIGEGEEEASYSVTFRSVATTGF